VVVLWAGAGAGSSQWACWVAEQTLLGYSANPRPLLAPVCPGNTLSLEKKHPLLFFFANLLEKVTNLNENFRQNG